MQPPTHLSAHPSRGPRRYAGALRPRSDAVALSPERSLGPVGDARALEDRREVRLDGALTDPEPLSDLLVEQALDDQAQHLGLAGRQVHCGAEEAGARGVPSPEQVPGGPWVQGRLATSNRADAVDEVPGLCVLEQVAASQVLATLWVASHQGGR